MFPFCWDRKVRWRRSFPLQAGQCLTLVSGFTVLFVNSSAVRAISFAPPAARGARLILESCLRVVLRGHALGPVVIQQRHFPESPESMVIAHGRIALTCNSPSDACGPGCEMRRLPPRVETVLPLKTRVCLSACVYLLASGHHFAEKSGQCSAVGFVAARKVVQVVLFLHLNVFLPKQ